MKSREQHMLDLLEHVDWECFDLAKVEVVIDARDEDVRRAEREAIVRMLVEVQEEAQIGDLSGGFACELAIKRIERGEHLK